MRQQHKPTAILKNYFKTACRNLSRNRGYAFMNIAGLAGGMAACLLIFLVIQYETSFDHFHPNRERIYRVSTRFNRAGDIMGYYQPLYYSFIISHF